MKGRFAELVSDYVKPALRTVYYIPIDLIDRFGGRDRMIPPKSLSFVGDGDFTDVGNLFKQYFIDLADLRPDERVLDVGCGIGRMAVPLTDYLSQEGEYWGFDIKKKGIDWCQTNISSQYANFHFQHIDVYNKNYNRKGKLRAEDFRFPFEDGYFDFVFLTSVFTHMLPSDLENYLSEISRVLKPGGRCLITFFILNEESRNLIRSGRTTLDFKYEVEECLTVDDNNPEVAIAYNEDRVKQLFADYQLRISEPIHYGSWCERDTPFSYQDIIIATKASAN